MRFPALRAACAAVIGSIALAACGGNKGITPPPPTSCSPAALGNVRVNAATVTTLAALQGATASAADLPGCISFTADNGTYLVVPQFAAEPWPQDGNSNQARDSTPIPFSLGAQGAAAQMVAAGRPLVEPRAMGAGGHVQAAFDYHLRRMDNRLVPLAHRTASQRAALRLSVTGAGISRAPIDSTRVFKLCSDLACDSSKTDTSTLHYSGTNILIYVSDRAPPPPDGFSDAQLAAFGQEFDQELYNVDVQNFGAPSDIDSNGHVIVLLTPVVNAITPRSLCTSGYVAGFFYGGDLLPPDPQYNPFTNQAEVFYSMVPDPSGQFSCSHSQSEVEQTTPSTFIHEFQHMISFNQHVLIRNGNEEDVWLNEGMSHIAEELGSRYFENKYPPPADRTNPAQIFPDSAAPFINGDLFNSYAYLLNSNINSITQFVNGGDVSQRGGAWLFLRWLGDQTDSTIYTKLEQTSLTGIANLEAATGEKFPQLFGDFSVALYTDSLPGVPRDQIPPQYRFTSRNLRMLYQALYNATSSYRSQFPRPFPIALGTISPQSGGSGTMDAGTMSFFGLQMPSSGGARGLTFTPQPGAGTTQNLGAQVSVFRCPSAQACQ